VVRRVAPACLSSFVLHYAKSTLLCCPARRYCVTALYNFRSVIFYAALVSDGKFRYCASALVTDEAASREIAMFVSCDYDICNYPLLLLWEEGPLLFVFPSRLPNVVRPLALKISRDARALATERAILNYLRSCESPSQDPNNPS
jgi:hypothetical protein